MFGIECDKPNQETQDSEKLKCWVSVFGPGVVLAHEWRVYGGIGPRMGDIRGSSIDTSDYLNPKTKLA
ncbi:hypothetical protein N24_2838 [Corynebacterium suranareeae]|uniref:Uncharacterized protein n=1 Tax=Corynebacterium suranareeae TaxID=2506452 RepID=A0A160PW43_9CORY|nr:hypothetical protein [Corynebacterium suranareeae]BAU97100.1 hypothetical protein N24_2838 [Corynebacterium suranareeae]